jgi:biotin transport system substrate-specific component
MALYLLLGSLGYHVFAGQNWGLQTLLGATGGYLVGFVLAQPVIGAMTAARSPTLLGSLGAALAGHAIVFACGVVWLMAWLNADLATALQLGFWPFVPGTVVKSALAVVVSLELVKLRRRWFS